MFLQKLLLTQADIDLVFKTTPDTEYRANHTRFSRLKSIYLGRLGIYFILMGFALMVWFGSLAYITGSPLANVYSFGAIFGCLAAGAVLLTAAALE